MTTNTHFECAIDGVLDRFPGTPSDPQPPPPDNPTERFPGDPNPKVSGRTYWGQGGANREVATRLESGTGTKIGVRRRYMSASDFNSSLKNGLEAWIDEDHSNNRVPCVSFKFPDWANAAAGGYDSAYLDPIIAMMEGKSKPVWLIVNHEPEGDGTAVNWRNMQSHIRSRITAYRNAHPTAPRRIAFGANLMAFTWNTTSGRNPEDYWVANTWDFYLADYYTDTTQAVLRTNPLINFINWTVAKNIPYGFGEWGLRSEDASRTTKMQDFWNQGIDGNHDCIGYMYYDTDVNSTGTGWEMDSSLLTKFKSIMQSADSMNLSDLGY
jgi:hypothetical protein